MTADFDTSLPPIGPLVDGITNLISNAAAAINAIDHSILAQRIKPDLSPVTAADDVAQSLILDGLSRLLPGVPIVSEEAEDVATIIIPGSTFLMVDPLDGTREFLAGRDEFTVNVALVTKGIPIIGCIAAPALGLIWRGVIGQGAERLELPAGADVRTCRNRRAIRTRSLPDRSLIVAISRSHFDTQTENLIARFSEAQRIACGSSLKFCRLAEGHIDLYPRLAPTHEWDIAAGHAIVVAAGGTILRPNGEPLTYGRSEDGYLVPGFIACGDPTTATRILQVARPN